MNHRRASFRTIVLAGLVLFVTSPAARAQFVFTNIADSDSPMFNSFGNSPAINAGGTVAFFAIIDFSAGGDSGLFTGAGGVTNMIARGDDPTFNTGFSSFGGFEINAGGTVVFYALLDSNDQGIFTGDGGPPATISNAGFSMFSAYGWPAINTSGRVAFEAALDGGGSGIYTVAGGLLYTIALSSGPTFSSFGSIVSMNDAGTVAFRASLDAGGTGIFTGAGGATTTIALSSGPTFSSFSEYTSINTAGTVAFRANLDAGGSGIFTGNGGATTNIALSSGPTFSSFGEPAINSAGTVAFFANLDAGGSGIYLGDGGAGTKVIKTGDALFGSTVSGLNFNRRGLNDAGELAFGYTLANGRTGIARARLAEPAILSVARVQDKVVVSWPQGTFNQYYLEGTESLSLPISWSNVTNPMVATGSRFFVTNDISGGARFYRLHAQ